VAASTYAAAAAAAADGCSSDGGSSGKEDNVTSESGSDGGGAVPQPPAAAIGLSHLAGGVRRMVRALRALAVLPARADDDGSAVVVRHLQPASVAARLQSVSVTMALRVDALAQQATCAAAHPWLTCIVAAAAPSFVHRWPTLLLNYLSVCPGAHDVLGAEPVAPVLAAIATLSSPAGRLLAGIAAHHLLALPAGLAAVGIAVCTTPPAGQRHWTHDAAAAVVAECVRELFQAGLLRHRHGGRERRTAPPSAAAVRTLTAVDADRNAVVVYRAAALYAPTDAAMTALRSAAVAALGTGACGAPARRRRRPLPPLSARHRMAAVRRGACVAAACPMCHPYRRRVDDARRDQRRAVQAHHCATRVAIHCCWWRRWRRRRNDWRWWTQHRTCWQHNWANSVCVAARSCSVTDTRPTAVWPALDDSVYYIARHSTRRRRQWRRRAVAPSRVHAPVRRPTTPAHPTDRCW